VGENTRIPNAEGTAYPWWAIICPNRIHNVKDIEHRIAVAASSVVGPFFSRESAQGYLDGHRYRYGDDAVVYCMSGHESPDWRGFCREPHTTQEQK